MSRYTTEHFECDWCKTVGNSMLFENITIITKKSHHRERSFCSFRCFIDFFNKAMKEDKTGVEIRDDS